MRAGCRQVDAEPAGTSREIATRYKKVSHDGAAIEALFVDLFLKAHDRAPREIVLDLDATDDPLHGHQEGRFFHGYYDGYSYLPLYVFCGEMGLVADRADPLPVEVYVQTIEPAPWAPRAKKPIVHKLRQTQGKPIVRGGPSPLRPLP